jgi:hypothetical protein
VGETICDFTPTFTERCKDLKSIVVQSVRRSWPYGQCLCDKSVEEYSTRGIEVAAEAPERSAIDGVFGKSPSGHASTGAGISTAAGII